MFPLLRSHGAHSSATSLLGRLGQTAQIARRGIHALPRASSYAACSTLLRARPCVKTAVAQQPCFKLLCLANRGCDKPFDQQKRYLNIEIPRDPVAGSEPGIDIQNEEAWPEWRKKAAQVRTHPPSVNLNYFGLCSCLHRATNRFI